MMPRRKSALLLGVVSLALAVLPGVAAAQQAATDSQAKTPIEHVIVLMQENHSFDNYFGTYPGADGIPADVCMPVDPNDRSNPTCIKPFHIGNRAIEDLDHNMITAKRQYRDGAMDGFVDAFRQLGKDGTLTMGYYDGRDVPFYWNLVDDYVLFDRFFSSAAGGSVKNHMYWVSGTPGNKDDRIPQGGWGTIPTIFDRLQERGISWKFYVQNYDPKITYRALQQAPDGRDPPPSDRAAQVVWVPLLAYARFLDRPELNKNIVSIDEYYKDVQNGTLPAVAFMVPSGASEHPPGSILAGQRFVKKLLNALMQSEAWNSSMFMVTYDDWGGWYDHVSPPVVDDQGYGFRVPAFLVSAYARKGYIDSTVLDYTSILKFIEDNWSLAPLAARDAKANSIASAFDFSQAPRPPRIINSQRNTEPPPEPRRAVIVASYSSAIGIALLITAWAQISTYVAGRRTSRSQETQETDEGAV